MTMTSSTTATSKLSVISVSTGDHMKTERENIETDRVIQGGRNFQQSTLESKYRNQSFWIRGLANPRFSDKINKKTEEDNN